MLIKTAIYKFVDPQPLNIPIFKGKNSYLKADPTLMQPGVLEQTIRNIKTASKIAEIDVDSDSPDFDLEAEIKSHPDSLYVKCFAIKSDETNDNGDHFQKSELKKATGSFIGVPVFTNHNNSDAEEARGKVVHSWWDEDKNGIMIIARVDAEAYPKLARGIKEEYIAGCFPGDAPVLMEDGSEKPICDIEDGDYVISHTGQSRKVLGTRSRRYHHSLLNIKLEGIKQPIVCTAYHNLMAYHLRDECACGCGQKLPNRQDGRITASLFNRKFVHGHNPRGGNTEFEHLRKIKACEIKIGDFLFEPKILDDSCDAQISEDEAFLIGLFAAEGSFEKRDGKRLSVIFNFGSTELETIAKHCHSLLQKLFPNRNPTINHYPESSQTRICVYGNSVAEWFYKNCGEYSDQKSFHPNLIKLGRNKTASLIAGYMEGDGYNVKNKSYGAATVSTNLASQLRILFQKIGIRNSYRVRQNLGDWGYKPVHEITCGLTTSSILSDVLIYKKADSSEYKPANWHNLDNLTLRRVKSIQEIDFDGLVYDIEVDQDHTYCVNHIAVSNTSMGCQVAYSVCSICHNRAENASDYCSHIRERKTRKISEKNIACKYHESGGEGPCPICNCKEGETKKYAVDNQEVFEYNYGIKFIENSFVVNPACHDCGVTEIIDPQEFLKKVAVLNAKLPRLLKAAASYNLVCTDQGCIKYAGQKEIDTLNEALNLVTAVGHSMLKQHQQIDLEFLSDLMKVAADLQETIDELTQQGYRRLPSPPESGDESGFGAQTQNQTPELQPMNPTPGGGSKVQTGPAGEAGTVTGPLANRKSLNLKIGSLAGHQKHSKIFRIRKILQKNACKHLNLRLN